MHRAHRMRLFRLSNSLLDKPVIAWSAGAMVLGERIVLFHDTPPQGSAWAEVMEQGFGLLPDLVPRPHAAAVPAKAGPGSEDNSKALANAAGSSAAKATSTAVLFLSAYSISNSASELPQSKHQ